MTWTARRFIDEMRAAGWERIDSRGQSYVHKDGYQWHGEQWTAERGVHWRYYCERETTPPLSEATRLAPRSAGDRPPT